MEGIPLSPKDENPLYDGKGLLRDHLSQRALIILFYSKPVARCYHTPLVVFIMHFLIIGRAGLLR